MGVDSDYFQFLRYPSLAFGPSSSLRSPRSLSDDQSSAEVASLKQMGDRPASLVEFLRQRTGGNGMSHSAGDDSSRSDGSRRFGGPQWHSEPDDCNSSVASSIQDQQNIAMSGNVTPTTNVAAVAASDNKANSKRSRYLRESDRRNIIRRIGYGEKQASLAKEYGVTRAAICHINKNKMEIMTRSTRADVHSAARHPKRGLYNTSSKPMLPQQFAVQEQYSEQPSVYQVRSQPLTILLTQLRSKGTRARNFRQAADRAIRLLLEEALACAATQSIEIMTPNEAECEGLELIQSTCGISVGDGAFPMLDAFRSIQPDSATGVITLENSFHDHMSDGTIVRNVYAPLNLRQHAVFLMSPTCANGAGAGAAIQAILDLGVAESSIFYVSLMTSAMAVSDLCNRFPAVRIVTAAIDPDLTEEGAISPGMGYFVERYLNTSTTVHYHCDSSSSRSDA